LPWEILAFGAGFHAIRLHLGAAGIIPWDKYSMRLEDFYSYSPKYPLSQPATWVRSSTSSPPTLELIRAIHPPGSLHYSGTEEDRGLSPEEIRTQEELLDLEHKIALKAAGIPDTNPIQREIAHKRRRKYPHVINKYDSKATPNAVTVDYKSPEKALRAQPQSVLGSCCSTPKK
jgi:hypothetical protein